MDLLLDGFQTALTPTNLMFAVLGVLLGTAVGVLPGIGPAMTVALLLPVTYNVSPSSAQRRLARVSACEKPSWRPAMESIIPSPRARAPAAPAPPAGPRRY